MSDSNSDPEKTKHSEIPPKQVDDSSQSEMTFLEHLEEFRWTACRSIVAFLAGVLIIVCFLPNIGGFLQIPLQHTQPASSVVVQELCALNEKQLSTGYHTK